MSTFQFFRYFFKTGKILGNPFTEDCTDATLLNLNSYSGWITRHLIYHKPAIESCCDEINFMIFWSKFLKRLRMCVKELTRDLTSEIAASSCIFRDFYHNYWNTIFKLAIVRTAIFQNMYHSLTVSLALYESKYNHINITF